ncbi:MAG: hypothetical protein FJW37_04735 [Acidobacteria bacterium]|nr:hypothetical protein [Acidobacteriota bacterium]
MRKTAIGLCVFACLAAVLPAAQVHGDAPGFRPRFQSLNRAAVSGECKRRVRVDDQVEVMMFDDQVRLRTVSGRPAYDLGSECTGPLPRRGILSFEFRKTDGPGEARLLRQPDERDGRLSIYVRDDKGGDHKYTLEFRWTAESRQGEWRDREDDRFSGRPDAHERVEACLDEVRARIREDGYRDPDITETSIGDRGPRDRVYGEATARRGRSRDHFQWECSVNPSGRVRQVEVWRR